MRSFMMILVVCSVTMSALVVLYMAITPLLAKRYSVTGRYYTWLILVIGLIIPFRPQFGNAIVKIDMPGQTAAPITQIGNGASVATPAPPLSALPAAVPNLSWWQIAAAVWLAGAFIFLAYHVIKHYRFLKLTARWSENVTDRQTLTRFQNLKAQMGLSQKIGLKTCGSIGSPMMIGLANPCVLLPNIDFAEDELSFILKHELVHYKRKDLWYKFLVLTATAIHWFNPIVRLMARVIDLQCELSCDAVVVRSKDADTRQQYSETIIGVVRYQSKRKTALSTNFYGGKKGMKNRIFSIMDMSKKKAGAAVLCGALVLTMGTGFALAANAETQNAETRNKEIVKDNPIAVTPWISVGGFVPSPDIYAPYAAFGLTISEDGKGLLYEGRPVRQFVDEKADGWAFYLDEAGGVNLSAVRNSAGEISGVESMTAQKAREYYESFFAEELREPIPNVQDMTNVQENVQIGPGKYEKYKSFGITYSEMEEVLYFNGQKVKFFIDQPAGEGAEALWTDAAGTVNLEVIRDASGQITGIESISDEKVREYQSAADQHEQNALNGLEEKIEAKI